MHVIPWCLLRQLITGGGPKATPASTVTMSNSVFQMLLEAALAGDSFDRQAYLAANQDVAEAVRQGKCPDARAHYAGSGYFEGRPGGGAAFDEAWYLKRYPDVLNAVRTGRSVNGLEHFRGPGIREWRSPNAAAEADIARWHAAAQKAPATLAPQEKGAGEKAVVADAAPEPRADVPPLAEKLHLDTPAAKVTGARKSTATPPRAITGNIPSLAVRA